MVGKVDTAIQRSDLLFFSPLGFPMDLLRAREALEMVHLRAHGGGFELVDPALGGGDQNHDESESPQSVTT